MTGAPPELAALEAAVCASIEADAPEVDQLVASIGAQPELGYQEHVASSRIREVLERHGLPWEGMLAGLETAFRSRVGEGSPRIALLAEYDALPELGHACGHNVIAGAGVGAFLGLSRHWRCGTLELIGCPAEESTVDGAGGKIRLLDAGVFDAVDAALMIHPYDQSAILTEGALAGRGVDLDFHGVAAHAALEPQAGRNALDAAVQAYGAIAMLRQHLDPAARVHGIVTGGGRSPSVVPDFAALRFRVRAPTAAAVEDVFARVLHCAQGAATATGCSLQWSEFMPLYEEMRQAPELVDIGRAVLEQLGEVRPSGALALTLGSSDFGNVSQRVSALEIGIALASPGVALHTREFAAAACAPAAGARARVGARALALTAIRAAERLIEQAGTDAVAHAS